MRFWTDVVVVGGESKALHMIHAMRPRRNSRIVPGSKLVIELPAGTPSDTMTSLGDTLTIDRT
jgi:uncharacterized membrane protein (UPF0127 family)